MSKPRPKIRSSQWRTHIESAITTLREYMTWYRASEVLERGHECGHTFTVRVTSRGHYSVTGDPEHRDAPDGDGDDLPWTIQVRAHNLRDALLQAALTPLGEGEWIGPDLEEVGS